MAGTFREVPIDPHIHFFGDDLAFALRAWTAGWDFYSPHRPVLFHLWDCSQRPAHWSDLPGRAHRLRELSQRRIAHLVGTEETPTPRHSRNSTAMVSAARAAWPSTRNSAASTSRRRPSARVPSGARSVPNRRQRPPRRRRRRRRPWPPRRRRRRGSRRSCAPRERSSSTISCPRDTTGSCSSSRRLAHLGRGFTLRSEKDLIVHASHATKREGSFHYPSGTPLDRFVEAIQAALPDVAAMVGHPEGWHHLSVTSWIYPPNAALALRDAGPGVHGGAYVYYLNPEWKPHWGGLLVVLDHQANRATAAERGLGRCIFPKKNRIVFLAPDAQHLVTRVLAEAGDNVRMSLNGFFHRPAPTPPTR
jgi:hypothetical protein